MRRDLIDRLNQYASRDLASSALEDWIVEHLDAIGAGGDQAAMAIVDEMDGLLVQMSEGVVTEVEVLEVAARIVREEATLNVSMGDMAPPEVVDSASAQTISREDEITALGETVHLELQVA